MMMIPIFHLPWRTIQISINIVTIVLGFMTFMPLSYTKSYFNNNCVLYSYTRFEPTTSGVAENIVVNTRASEWGAPPTCNFVTFLSVIVCIHAFIWGWFLLLMKLQLKHEQHEHTLLFPCFVMHALVLIIVFVSSSMIQAGMESWCRSLTKELYKTYNKQYTCADTQYLNWNILEKQHKFYTFLLVAKISSWLLTLSLLAQTLVSGYKIYVWILKTEDTTPRTPQKSPHKTCDSTSGYITDVNNDDYTLTITSEIEWDNDDSTCETSRAISFNV